MENIKLYKNRGTNQISLKAFDSTLANFKSCDQVDAYNMYRTFYSDLDNPVEWEAIYENERDQLNKLFSDLDKIRDEIIVVPDESEVQPIDI